MSPTQEDFEGGMPDFVGEAYGVDQDQEFHEGGSVADSGQNSDLLSELARLTTRLDEMEARRAVEAPAMPYGTPVHGVQPTYGYGLPARQQQLSVNDLGSRGGRLSPSPGYFARRSGVYGSGAQAWRQQLEEQYRLEYQQQFAREREQLQRQFQHEYLMEREGLQRQYQEEVQQVQQGVQMHAQGNEALLAEVRRLQEANQALQRQARLRTSEEPMTHAEMGLLDPNVVRVPTAAQAKISQQFFDGTELYKGLGAGFVQWGRQFLVKIDLAEQACGFRWPERYKCSRFGDFLRGTAAQYYLSRFDGWWRVTPTLGHVMDRMMDAYKIVFSRQLTIKLFSERKDKSRSWNDHLLYLTALAEATGSGDDLILENIVKHAAPESKALIIGQYDPRRTDFLAHAEEIVLFIQGIEDETVTGRTIGREVVNAVTETRTCHGCGEVGHIRRFCPDGRRHGQSPRGGRQATRDGNNVRWALHVSDGNLEDDDWILDTGASCHLVRDATMLYDAERCGSREDCVQPDGSRLQVTRRGKTSIWTEVDGATVEIELSGACFAPGLQRNLISYGRLVQQGCILQQVDGRHAIVKRGEVVFYVALKNHVLVVDQVAGGAPVPSMSQIVMSAVASEDVDHPRQKGTLLDFHKRFGHLSYDTIERMAQDPRSGIELTDHKQPHCLTCAQGKQTRAQQPTRDSGENAPIDQIGGVICSDLKGPITPRDRLGNRYLVNFVDHKSNYTRVFLAKTKDEAANKFKHFLVYFEKRFNCRIHVLRTDGGGEYVNVDLFCRETGVTRQVTEANNQAANGKAERMHRTVMNMVRCMLFACGLPLSFWGDAAEYAAYILNRMPTRANAKRMSPLEVLTGKTPSLVEILVFGSPCDVFRDPKKNSLQRRSTTGMIVGRSDETKGYRVYLSKERVVITTRHIKRVETLSDEANAELQRVLDAEAEDDLEELARTRQLDRELAERRRARETEETKQSEPPPTASAQPQVDAAEPDVQAPRRSSRPKKKSTRLVEAEQSADAVDQPTGLVNAVTAALRSSTPSPPQELVNAVVDAVQDVFEAEFANLPDPKNYREAMRSPDRAKWIRAHVEELESLRANNTWRIVKAIQGMQRLHTKWVHKKKKLGDGALERYKARLVACGNEQIFGVNFLLTFAAVLDLTSAKAILAIARVWRVPARHFDVPSAYVRAAKEDGVDIYLYIPDGMVFTDGELAAYGVTSASELALCLERSLYGLKQAGRLWHQLLHATLVGAGYTQCITDTCLYYKTDSGGTTLVGTYVDDLLVTATSTDRVDAFFAEMGSLELKDLGPAEKFLGMRIAYDDATGYQLDQEHTILEFLAKHGLEKVNATRTPVGDDQDTDATTGGGALLPASGTGTPEHPTVRSFQSLLGSLLWVARCTRPDISFAVHKASRRAHAPTVADFKAAKRIARYLAGTASLKLHMGASADTAANTSLVLDSYTDADFASEHRDRKSISGGIIRLNGMLVGWHCRKQTAVALSTAEAEYVAGSVGAKELLGLKELAVELSFVVQLPMTMHMDNQAAIRQIENEASSSQAKHVDIRLKFLTDYCAKGVIKPTYVATQDMLADLLTKAIAAPQLLTLRAAIGLQ